MADASVLVVEDNTMSRATAVDMFIDLGFAVFDAYNGYHALALLERHPEISLLFVDVRMPGMSGPELAELVRHDVPISRSFYRATLARNSWRARSLRAQALAGGPGCQSGWRMSGLRVRWAGEPEPGVRKCH